MGINRDRSRVILIVFSVGMLMILAGYLTEASLFFNPLQEALQERRIATNMLDNGALGKIIKKLDLVESDINDGKRFPTTKKEDEHKGKLLDRGVEKVTFQRKRKPNSFLYSPVDYRPDHQSKPYDLVKSVVQKEGWPVLSINLPDRSLHDPEIGLLANRDKYGRNWERKADVVFYNKGEILLSSSAGLRIHGGSRRTTKPYQSYKLYFREEYGVESIPSTFLFNTSGDIRTLVVHILRWPVGQPINTPLAYDISRQIGAPAPETRLFEVYLNGKSEGMAFVTEHLSRRQFSQYMTGEKYIFRKYKEHFDEASVKVFFNRVWRYVIKLTESSFPDLEKAVDIDSFSRHVFSWDFSGDEDYCQGVGVLDTGNPAAKFYWINWDMDHSFYDRKGKQDGFERANWKQNGIKLIYKVENHYCDRTLIFSRWMERVPRYKKYVIDLYTEILNHRLTDAFLTARLNFYSAKLSSFGDYEDYVAMLQDFMENRSDFIRADMAEKFNLSGPYTLTVKGDTDIDLTVDGYAYKDSYIGKYYGGQRVKIQLNENSPSHKNSHWRVNGELMVSQPMDIAIDSDTVVEVVDLKEKH